MADNKLSVTIEPATLFAFRDTLFRLIKYLYRGWVITIVITVKLLNYWNCYRDDVKNVRSWNNFPIKDSVFPFYKSSRVVINCQSFYLFLILFFNNSPYVHIVIYDRFIFLFRRLRNCIKKQIWNNCFIFIWIMLHLVWYFFDKYWFIWSVFLFFYFKIKTITYQTEKILSFCMYLKIF